ncbi:LOW QUALITY PROTEIN: cytoplasmic polyadenylation element-binding protein 1-like [Brienomyrus brachyistius]|uniref:LOW QUALITY PROTEIN: cytoplasmic polyadenylation element-binding protein 1-like n=1 Tax=Brienomyrus brachyistius TaxID=42636 RepID=UPI0020B24B0E|nr:LOW QUALITY PROTEIN: cytoplasmic polyadenylation element-binding protein 1-like [Brienomyrus brachyistius]
MAVSAGAAAACLPDFSGVPEEQEQCARLRPRYLKEPRPPPASSAGEQRLQAVLSPQPTPTDLRDSDATAVLCRMLFPSSTQDSARVLPDGRDRDRGLHSLSLPGWDRPRSGQSTETSLQKGTPSMLGMPSSPLGSILGKPLGFPFNGPVSTPDFQERFSNMARLSSRLESHSLLDSRSSSPVDSETSGFSSGSDHLCDLLSSLRISPPLPFLMSSMQKDAIKLAVSSHLDQDSSLLAPSPSTGYANAPPKRWPGASVWPGPDTQEATEDPFSIEREARLHRQAAAVNEATLTWNGQLPSRSNKNAQYSCKVFLGGVPWDVTEAGLINTFSAYGPLSVEWPGKDGKHPRCPPKGYVYLVFESEKSVRGLLQACTQDMLHPEDYSEYYFRMSSRRMRCKDVQVIPWVISDSNYVRCPSQRLDPSKTVFVGALHGMLNAEALAMIMNALFGGVMYAGIDTDKHKYPIGSGRVTFNNQRSYLKAVSAAFVEIKTPKFTKKVQIDPYLEDSMCHVCNRQPGPFFCRDQACFKYYCRSCWHWQHCMEALSSHRPMMRHQKNQDSS